MIYFKDSLRKKRLIKLEASDWTQAADSPLSEEKKAEWRVYRQKLRDIPQDFPDATCLADITFPTKPT
tara:strand:- start:282 stop:485 length:204 start_codon:yes stop_codon:yes gene_type:complete